MGLTVKASSGASTFKSVPAGMHLARCYRIIDKGTQITNYKGKVGASPKVMIQFEVHSEDADGNPLVTDKGEPMTISKNFTASLAVPVLAVGEAGGGRGEPGCIVAAVNDSREWTHTIAFQTPRSATSSKIVSRRWMQSQLDDIDNRRCVSSAAAAARVVQHGVEAADARE
jgi:hypothetical protein